MKILVYGNVQSEKIGEKDKIKIRDKSCYPFHNIRSSLRSPVYSTEKWATSGSCRFNPHEHRWVTEVEVSSNNASLSDY